MRRGRGSFGSGMRSAPYSGDGRADFEDDGTKVYVGNLPWDCDWKALKVKPTPARTWPAARARRASADRHLRDTPPSPRSHPNSRTFAPRRARWRSVT